MKVLKELKLSNLNKNKLISRQMNAFKGGGSGDSTCNCGCAYVSAADNMAANSNYGYQDSAGFGDPNDYGEGYKMCTCVPNSAMTNARNANYFAGCIPI
jgi:natural product precursor